MRKGSPQDYTAEIGCSKQPTQKSRLGEPHECYSLYRMRRTQENYQFLRKDGRRPDCGRRQIGSRPYGVAALGGGSKTSLAWRHGSHAVQCLDLRHAKALCPATFYGPPGQDEGHYRGARTKAIRSMHVRLPICCVATCFLPAMYYRHSYEICDVCSVIATWWSSNRCACKTKWPVC